MKRRIITRSNGKILLALVIIFAIVGCSQAPATATQPPANSPTTDASVPSPDPGASPAPAASEVPATSAPTDASIVFRDDFTNEATNWSKAEFDNYFIGYHEPEYYHVEITRPNSKAPVISEPQRNIIQDATIELEVLTVSARTATDGDYRYGLAFRRSGDQYYSFTISPTTKKWYLFKSSPSGSVTLQEGVEQSINELDVKDLLRVDLQGPNFTLHINDRMVGEVTDPDYVSGEVGLYVENLENPNTHVHFDALTIRNFEAPIAGEQPALYEDDFTSEATNWSKAEFDNYFIGYHEPEYYHVEITQPNSKAPVISEPERHILEDATVELEVLTVSARTATDGDYRYGLAFRRSGDQYYAFTISPTSKKWSVFKSTPSGQIILQEGEEQSINELDVKDLLRVDAQGPNFLFHINDRLVGQVTDSDYASGEVGLYVENLTNPNTHVHFDKLTIRDVQLRFMCQVVNDGTLYVRTGPGKTFAQVAVLTNGDSVSALGISPNQWIKIKVEGSDQPGWVSYSEGYLSCTPTVDVFPVVTE